MQSLAGSATFSLTGGGVGYGRFSVASGGTGSIVISAAGGVVPANVVMLLIRTQ
jgi:hypothetical protein